MHLIRYPSRIQAQVNDVEHEWLTSQLEFPITVGQNESGSLLLWLERRREFPSGLLRYIAKRAKLSGFEVTIEDARKAPMVPDLSLLDWVWFPIKGGWSPLRQDQRRSVVELYSRGPGMVEASTGSGKGAMVVGIVAALPEAVWGIFAPSNQLLADLKNRLELNGFEVGEYTADKQDLRPITVFSYDKLNVLRKEDPDEFKRVMFSLQGIIVDEAHTCAAATRSRVLSYCINAYWRFGLSATPEDRTDGRTPVVIGLLGPVVTRIEYEDLVEDKAVAAADIKMVVFRHEEPAQRNSYTHFYKANIQNNPGRNRLIRRLVDLAEKPAIVFATLTKHVLDIYDMVRKDGANTGLAYGKVKKAARAQVVKDANDGRIDVIVGSAVFDTGIDIPCLASVCIADAGASAIKSTQKVGRGMRPTKDRFTIYDIYDVGFRKNDGSPGAFEAQSVKRMKTYVKKGYNVEIVEYDFETRAIRPYTGAE